jgi:predicted enzyme related to lactoylglutathione lyase
MMSEMTGDAISWFEIPVRDLQRAQRFYETVLGRALKHETMGDEQLAVFPAGEGRAQGCLLRPSQPIEPSAVGTRVYLDASPSLDGALDRVKGAGGRITTPKVALPPGMGYFAHVSDTEGNVVGLHALA